MKVIDLLRLADLGGMKFSFITEQQRENDEDELWKGFFMDIPFWIGEMTISEKKIDGDPAIAYCRIDNMPGLSILLKDEEED